MALERYHYHRRLQDVSEAGGKLLDLIMAYRSRPPKAKLWLAADNLNKRCESSCQFAIATRPHVVVWIRQEIVLEILLLKTVGWSNVYSENRATCWQV
jgi:hypothetical protein